MGGVAGLTLLHPWLLAGLAAASLPVLIHLIGRRRAPTVWFAAFDFLLAVNKRLARRERVRQILLLLLRTLAVAALVLAVARPLPNRTLAAAGTTSRRLALVIDTSASMGYRLDGSTLLERAKELARDVLSHLQPGDTVTLVAAGSEARLLLPAPTLDVAQARAALEALQVGPGAADLGPAMDAALGQYDVAAGSVTLVVVSDLAANGFRNVRPTAREPPPEVRLLDAAEREPLTALGNLAIESVAVERGSGAPAERRLEVVVRNYGAAAVRDRNLEVAFDGEVLANRLYFIIAVKNYDIYNP